MKIILTILFWVAVLSAFCTHGAISNKYDNQAAQSVAQHDSVMPTGFGTGTGLPPGP